MIVALLAAAAMGGTPTITMTVLAHAKQAAGGEALGAIRTLHFEQRVSAQGLKGTGEEWDDLTTGRFLQSQSLGPVSGRQGYDGVHAWQSDATGIAHRTGSEYDVATAVTQSYVTSLSYFFPDRVPGTITYEGKKTIGAGTYFELRAQPRGGYPVDLWFDATTYLLAREVTGASPARLTTTDLSDYRAVAGAVIPYKTHVVDSQGNEFEIDVASAQANAAPPASFAMPASEPNDFTIAKGAASATFPIELINNHIYLKAKVNGKGPYTFVFDTGGEGILNPDVAAKLGIRPAGALQASGAGAGTVQTGFAWVDKIQLGGATLSHQAFAILPLGPVMHDIEGVQIDGMVGYETAARYLTTIDYAHGTMTLSLPRPGVTPPGVAVPFVFYDTIPQFNGSVDGLSATVEVDTGSRSSLTLMSPYVAAHGLARRYPSKVQGIAGFGLGGPTSARLARISSLHIGSVDVPGVITDLSTDTQGAMADPTVSGNLGGGVLKRFSVTFDYRHQIMYLQKNANFDQTDVPDRSGLVLVGVAAGVRVMGVLTSTPAALAGIHEHDLILAVNGTPAAKLGLAKVRQILDGPPGMPVHLRVLSGSTTRDATLMLKDYVP